MKDNMIQFGFGAFLRGRLCRFCLLWLSLFAVTHGAVSEDLERLSQVRSQISKLERSASKLDGFEGERRGLQKVLRQCKKEFEGLDEVSAFIRRKELETRKSIQAQKQRILDIDMSFSSLGMAADKNAYIRYTSKRYGANLELNRLNEAMAYLDRSSYERSRMWDVVVAKKKKAEKRIKALDLYIRNVESDIRRLKKLRKEADSIKESLDGASELPVAVEAVDEPVPVLALPDPELIVVKPNDQAFIKEHYQQLEPTSVEKLKSMAGGIRSSGGGGESQKGGMTIVYNKYNGFVVEDDTLFIHKGGNLSIGYQSSGLTLKSPWAGVVLLDLKDIVSASRVSSFAEAGEVMSCIGVALELRANSTYTVAHHVGKDWETRHPVSVGAKMFYENYSIERPDGLLVKTSHKEEWKGRYREIVGALPEDGPPWEVLLFFGNQSSADEFMTLINDIHSSIAVGGVRSSVTAESPNDRVSADGFDWPYSLIVDGFGLCLHQGHGRYQNDQGLVVKTSISSDGLILAEDGSTLGEAKVVSGN